MSQRAKFEGKSPNRKPANGHLNGKSKVKKQEISQDYSTQQLRAYNRFLKEGRLTECLDRKGLLDMNNVRLPSFTL
ncbi:hypothetical protein LXL04_017278 [Taraxacum kok-saghyz]